jgi:hypothetical protein
MGCGDVIVQICRFGDFGWQHLQNVATPTIMNVILKVSDMENPSHV